MAKIRESFDRLRHSSFTDPRRRVSDVSCSLSPTGEVCGVKLCDVHRRMVTTWVGGAEVLRERRAAQLFADWGVVPTKSFTPEA